MSEIKLDVDQASELKAAFRREDWTNEEIKMLCERKGLLASVKRVLAGVAEVVLKKLFITAGTVAYEGAEATNTVDCFTGSIWKYRDSDFDHWLPKQQPKRDACVVTVLEPTQPWTFVEAAQVVLGVTTSDVKELGSLLIKGGHTLTLKQAEDLAERTEAGEATGLTTDGYANFFFVETGDEAQPVSVGDMGRDGVRSWAAGVDRLDYGTRWNVDDRFLLCNADTSKL